MTKKHNMAHYEAFKEFQDKCVAFVGTLASEPWPDGIEKALRSYATYRHEAQLLIHEGIEQGFVAPKIAQEVQPFLHEHAYKEQA